jgi:hypothetical protein
MLLVVAVVGCAFIGRAASPDPSTSSPDATADPTALVATDGPTVISIQTPLPSPDPTPTPTESPVATPSPTPRGTDDGALETSNRYWSYWFESCFFGAPGHVVQSLREIVETSDIVLVGRITDSKQRRVGNWDMTVVSVAINELLKGSPVTTRAGSVQVGTIFESPSGTNPHEIPDHANLWFLSLDDDDPAIYFMTDYDQLSLLRNIDGVVRVIHPRLITRAYSAQQFPVPLEGTSFDALIERVREVVGNEAGAGSGGASKSRIASISDASFAC